MDKGHVVSDRQHYKMQADRLRAEISYQIAMSSSYRAEGMEYEALEADQEVDRLTGHLEYLGEFYYVRDGS